MGWEVDPDGFSALLRRVHDEYPPVPLVITENGSAWDDVLDADGRVDDPERVAYLEAHLGAVLDAIDDGVDVRGYLAWSLLDNFEWGLGYSKRFGIVHVDYDTQVRTRKTSAEVFAAIAAANALPDPDAS